MSKYVTVLLAVFMVVAVGCKQKDAGKGMEYSKPTAQSVVPQSTPAADPHAGLKIQEAPAGAVHKGKVVETMNAGNYTYLQVEEKGRKLWVAAMKTETKKGDMVEFPDSAPMINFKSRTLNRTFDEILFANSLRVLK